MICFIIMARDYKNGMTVSCKFYLFPLSITS